MLFIKILCACLLTAGCTYTASHIVLQYKTKGKLIGELSESLNRMKSGISHQYKPISRIISELADGEESWRTLYKQLDGYLKKHKEAPLSEAFEFSASQFAKENALKDEDLSALFSLGDAIEQSDLLYVCNSIQAAAKELTQIADDYNRFYKSKAKVYNSIGLIIGLFSSILIL